MPSPRYLAEAFIFPRFVKERGVHAVLDAIEHKDAEYFIPVWLEAGFQFTPLFSSTTVGEYRIGVLSFPMPKEPGEAYFGILVGSTKRADVARYLTWELALSLGFEDETGTMIGEWSERGHQNFGAGPAFTQNLETDLAGVIDRVVSVVGGAN